MDAIRTMMRSIRPAPDGRTRNRRYLGASFGLIAAVLLAGGCSRLRDADRQPPAAPEAAVGASEFTIADNMNDIWNTVGQVLVRTAGVAYESRSQMLGIYALRYRGERLLIRTQAVVMDSAADTVRTRVMALHPDGRPNGSPAAIELLGLLEQRVPAEIEKYRQPIELKKKKKRARG